MQSLDTNTIKKLIAKSANGQLSEEEAQVLFGWIQSSEENKQLYVKIRDIDTYTNIAAYTEDKSIKKTGKLFKWGGIAATLILTASFWLIWEFKSPLLTSKEGIEYSNDVLLISEKGTYNLSEKLSNPSTVNQTTLVKLLNLRKDAEQAVLQDYTIIVPKGKTFQMTFDDGSHVILNAGSELKFPSVFSANERIVSLKGEALFQISKNKNKPFFVKTAQGEVKVLGTQFNIKSYPELPYETISLLEGRIEVSNTHDKQILRPGEQANLATSKITIDPNFDQEEVLAWKEGLFLFDNQPLEEVLKHVERWYNVQFKFSEEYIKNLPIYIKIRKERSINDLLKALETTNKIKFKKTEEVIYVTP